MSVLAFKALSYTYAHSDTPVFSQLSYTFDQGKIYAVTGRSGTGKTTLLSLLSGLMKPTEGQILYDGQNTAQMDPYLYRSQHVGVVFQSFNLLPKLTALENVILSMEVSGKSCPDKAETAMALLQKTGLTEEQAGRRVLKLSGGQQQRVAIARAISFSPKILLADEPTGNLDETTQAAVMDIFKRLAKEENLCVILVTHSPQVASEADDIFTLTPSPQP